MFAKEFLHRHHLHSLPIIPSRGSRFNILFDNAARTFFLREQMLQFLQQFGAENRLIKAVLCDIQVPELLASCKALGLVERLVTQPLWSVIEKKDVNVLDMNSKYKQLLDFCSTVNDNMDNFMKGHYLPFGDDTHITQDPIYDSLMETHEFDAATELYLRVIFPVLAVLCTRLFWDHLQGGIHGSLDVNDPTLRQKYKSVPKSSDYAERVYLAC